MKIRLMLAMLLIFSAGTSIYYSATDKTPAKTNSVCCGGDPDTIVTSPLPVPAPTPPRPGK